ncbi:MAG: sigma-70 family RNA polymerase sigma factor [SAR202 cluster bacterium]|nr:sigma-70 family RNA polymerase sigma factor [SAR202 cluster bacterium]
MTERSLPDNLQKHDSNIPSDGAAGPGAEDMLLVDGARKGDISAFNTIVERYQSHVLNLSARIVGDRHMAEDIAQETFISAHRALGGFRGGSLRAWLLRIASNLSYDHLRSSKRRPADSLDESMEHPGFAVPTEGPGPEEQAERKDLNAYIQKAILSLPPDQRTVLVMIYVQGLSYEETAESTGASLGTVKSRLSRARSRVREVLLQHRELLPDQFRQVH